MLSIISSFMTRIFVQDFHCQLVRESRFKDLTTKRFKESFPVGGRERADRRGEECSHSAVSEVLGHPHVALLAPAPPPAVLDRPEPAQLVLNTIVT